MRSYSNTRDLRHVDIPANLISVRCQTKIDNVLNDPDNHKVKDEYNHQDVRNKLRHYFGRKCVYCEDSPESTSTLRVDHYRPKKGIKDVVHTGYFWLSYEWTNLLQSCESCNKKKSNHFPLSNHFTRILHTTPNATLAQYRAILLAPLNQETRLLLHPELDLDVEQCFSFSEDGKIIGLNDRGHESIRCYHLNRENLIRKRKKRIKEYRKQIKRFLRDYELIRVENQNTANEFLTNNIKDLLFDLEKTYIKKGKFSLLLWHLFNNFELFFANRINVIDQRVLLMQIYNDYRATMN